jgi:hypothetical protein
VQKCGANLHIYFNIRSGGDNKFIPSKPNFSTSKIRKNGEARHNETKASVRRNYGEDSNPQNENALKVTIDN